MRVRDLQKIDESYALVLGTCGYESRSTFICQLDVHAPTRLAMLVGQPDPAVRENRDAFQRSGWETTGLREALTMLRNVDSGSRVCVDISSMPRRQMAMVVEAAWQERERIRSVDFLYCPARYEGSHAAAMRDEVLSAAPISEFFSGALRAPSLPVGLVAGLGLEPHRVPGLVELLEPAQTWAFMNVNHDSRFDVARDSLYSGVLERISAVTLEYRLDSIAETFRRLESLVFSVKGRFRLVLAPSGPKMFALACLLAGAERAVDRPAVWRVGSAGPRLPVDVEATGDVVAARLSWSRVAE